MGIEPTFKRVKSPLQSHRLLHPHKTRQTISGILLSTIIRLALTLPPESLPDTRWLPGTINTTCFRLLHLRCRPFHPDLTGSSLLPSLTFRWEDVILQAVPCSPDFPLRRAIVRPSCLVLFPPQMVGMVGFEPTASPLRTENSDQTELHPG